MKYDFKIKSKKTTYHFRISYLNQKKKTWRDKFRTFNAICTARFEGWIIVRDINSLWLPNNSKSFKREFVFRNLKELLEFRK